MASRLAPGGFLDVVLVDPTTGAVTALTADRAKDVEPAFTPDGPRGPRFLVQGGAIALAKLTGAAITPAGFAMSRCFVMERSWDRFRVPKPFSRVAVSLQPPMWVAKDDDEARARDDLARRIHAADARAQEIIERWNEVDVPS